MLLKKKIVKAICRCLLVNFFIYSFIHFLKISECIILVYIPHNAEPHLFVRYHEAKTGPSRDNAQELPFGPSTWGLETGSL